MNSLDILECKIKELLYEVEFPYAMAGEIDTISILYELASKSKWGKSENKNVNFISKKLDVSNKLFLGFNNNGKKETDLVLTDKLWLEILIAVLYKATIIESDGKSNSKKLKRFNTLFKAMDIYMPKWFSSESELGRNMESAWGGLIQSLPENFSHYIETNNENTNNLHYEKNETIIPLTVLFYEGPIARAYLETIKSLGFKPKKIIELVSAKDIVTKKDVGSWLPKAIRKYYAASVQRQKIHYWPNQLKSKNQKLISCICNQVQEKLGFKKCTLDNATALLPLSNYSDVIYTLLVDGLNDKNLLEYLLEEKPGAILFTGGGIVPSKLLELQHLKYLHIHPGFLPSIRGADCSLWSSLLTGYISASCFYMSPGIDIGDIIYSAWLPKLFFDIDIKNMDQKSIYRSVYSYLDPWVRSFVLRSIIGENSKFINLPSESQKEEDGETFHFMHERLQAVSFCKMFK